MIKTCAFCGKEFETYSKNQICCNRTCWQKLINKRSEEKFVGQKVNHWTILKLVKMKNKNRTRYLCQCECGTLKEFSLGDLKKSNSCGCIKKTLNGLSNTRLYGIYQKMKERCLNTRNDHYKNYGGRGITICEEWLKSYIPFREWALDNGYTDELTIDRIDVNGNYEPSNCRWVTPKEQARNKRNTIKITINDETRCLAEWCRFYKISHSFVYHRIKRNWDVMRAFLVPSLRTSNKADIPPKE